MFKLFITFLRSKFTRRVFFNANIDAMILLNVDALTTFMSNQNTNRSVTDFILKMTKWQKKMTFFSRINWIGKFAFTVWHDPNENHNKVQCLMKHRVWWSVQGYKGTLHSLAWNLRFDLIDSGWFCMEQSQAIGTSVLRSMWFRWFPWRTSRHQLQCNWALQHTVQSLLLNFCRSKTVISNFIVNYYIMFLHFTN